MSQQSPKLYQAMAALEAQVRKVLDSVLYKLIKIRSSQINGCAFCIDMHTKEARAAGESEQRIFALNAWRETPFFTERERAALALTEAVTLPHEGHVSDEVYDEASEYFDQPELAEVIWAINAWNRIAVSSRRLPGSYQLSEAR